MSTMETTFHLDGPLDLVRTVRPLELLPGTTRFDGPDAVWKAMRTATGPATLHLRMGHDRTTVMAEAWGPGSAAALVAAPGLAGATDAPDGLIAHDRIISQLQRRFRGLRVGRTGAVFDALVPAILGQKVAGKEAARSWRRMLEVHGEAAPGPVQLRVPPAPAVLGALPYEAFHPFGIERRRATTIIEAARHARRLQALTDTDAAGARRTLEAFPGIGPWTAALVAAAALGDPDAVPVGDYHVPHTVAWALAGEPRASDARMLELLEPYRGQRGRVVLLLKAAGINAPRFGPRRALRSIERI